MAEKFVKMGIPATTEEVLTSGYGAALYLKNTKFDKLVYVVGCEGIVQEMALAGIQCYQEQGNYLPHNEKKYVEEHFAKSNIIDPNVCEFYVNNIVQIGAVVAGYDNALNSYKIAYATLAIKTNKCQWIATNTDSTLPYASGIELPGAGTVVAAIQTATGQQPLVIGKPETMLLDETIDLYQLDRSKILMVGDRLETDIWMGNRGNVKTMAVYTGIATRDDVAATMTKDVHLQPTFAIESFGDLFKHLQQ